MKRTPFFGDLAAARLDKSSPYVPLKAQTAKGDQVELNPYLLEQMKQPFGTVSRRFLLLGDSGMGKSTALVNLFIDYVRKTLLFKEVRLFRLGDEETLAKVSSIGNSGDRASLRAKDCLLLLDGLDECRSAQDDLPAFMQRLTEATKNYWFVVLTARTQFFPSPDDERQCHGLPGNQKSPEFERLVLLPFDDDQVESYLCRRYGPGSDERVWAWEVVRKCPKEMSRPLLLSYMGYLLEALGRADTLLSIYDEIVYQWLKGEADKLLQDEVQKPYRNAVEADKALNKKASELWDQSRIMAVKMYQNHTDRVSIKDYRKMFAAAKVGSESAEAASKQFRRNSLLTREGESVCFAHRSFYEYFLAYAFILDGELIGNVAGIDTALALFDQLSALALSGEAPSGYRFAEVVKNVERFDLASALFAMGVALQELNRFKASEEKYTKALEFSSALSAEFPEAYLPRVADTLNNLATLHSSLGRHAEAEAEYASALEKYRALAETSPEAYLPDVAMTLHNLAVLHSDLGRHAEAEKEYEESLAIRRALSAESPEAYLPYVAQTLNNLANLHSALGRHAEAEKEYEESLEISRALTEKSPEAYRQKMAQTLYNFSLLREKQGKTKEAVSLARYALENYKAEHTRTGLCAQDVEDCRQLLIRLGDTP